MTIPFAWNTLKANQAKRVKAREPEAEPIEGAHGVYDPRPTQMGFTERQRLHDREVLELRAELEKRGAV